MSGLRRHGIPRGGAAGQAGPPNFPAGLQAVPGQGEGWNPLEKTNEMAARALGLRPFWLKVKGPIPDLEGIFTAMKNERAEGLLVLDVPIPTVTPLARCWGRPCTFSLEDSPRVIRSIRSCYPGTKAWRGSSAQAF